MGRTSFLPSSFTVRDIARNKEVWEADNNRRELLMQAISDCSSALAELKALKKPSGASSTQMLKTLHRKAQGHALLGQDDKALFESQESSKILTSSTPIALVQSTKDLLASLNQVKKDHQAIKVALEATASLVMKNEEISATRAAMASSIACAQAGGSVEAIIGVAAATAYNVVIDTWGGSEGVELQKALADFCESLVKAAHYHKAGPDAAALAAFDALGRKTLCNEIKLAGGGVGGGAVGKALSRERLRGAGVAAAMVASLRTDQNSAVLKACADGVLLCGGTAEEASEISSMFEPREEEEAMEAQTFEECESFRGKREGFVFKLGDSGLGYYKDVGIRGGRKGSGVKSKKLKAERLLDPAHPAFKDMSAEQLDSLEQMLKLKDEDVMSLPEDQREMITQFRSMYNSNPDAFKNHSGRAAANASAAAGKEGSGKGKEKEDKHDPTKWMKDHSTGLQWFVEHHGNFDRGKFEQEEQARQRRAEEDKRVAEERRKKVIDKEFAELFVPGAADENSTMMKKKKKVKTGKAKAKAKAAEQTKKEKKQRGKELKELMMWAT